MRCAGFSDAVETVDIDAGAAGVDSDRCRDVGADVVRYGREAGSFSEVRSREGDCVACLDDLGDTIGDRDCGPVFVDGIL